MINATKKWIFLKISSIILIPLLLWFIVNLVAIYDKNFDEILIFFFILTIKISNFYFNDCGFFLLRT